MKKMQLIFKTILKSVGVWLLLLSMYPLLKPSKESTVVVKPVTDTARAEAEFYRSLSMPEDVTTDR